MSKKEYTKFPVVVTGDGSGLPFLRLREIATRCMIQPDLVSHFVRFGLVDPIEWTENPEEWRFESQTVLLIQKIIRLQSDLEINYAGIGVILELLDRIETLEKRIRDLEQLLG